MKCLRSPLVLVIVIVMWMTLPLYGGNGTLRIGTFNMQNFGYGRSYCKSAQLENITQLISGYDLVALQEVMRVSSTGRACYGCSSALCQLDELKASLDLATGSNWRYVQCGSMHRGSRYEYLVFLFRETVTYLGMTGSVSNLSTLSAGCTNCALRPFLGNAPVYAKFKSGNFDFIIMDVHSPSSKGTQLYNASLGGAFDCLQNLDPHEQDIIMVGDFNDTSPAFSTTGALERIPDGDWTYDAIYIDRRFTGDGHEFTGDAGIVDVSRALSDHPIVWAAFSTTLPDDDH